MKFGRHYPRIHVFYGLDAIDVDHSFSGIIEKEREKLNVSTRTNLYPHRSRILQRHSYAYGPVQFD